MRRGSRTATAMVGLLGVAACSLGLATELEINLRIEGSTDPQTCTEYGVDTWELSVATLSNRRVVDSFSFACGSRWSSGVFSIGEGDYSVTATALDGAGQVVGAKSKAVGIYHSGATIWVVDLDFRGGELTRPAIPSCGDGKCDAGESCPADCKPSCGDGKCEVGESCPADCPASCGDGRCDGDETFATCPRDCDAPKDASLLISWKVNGTVDGTASGDSWDTCDEVGAAKVSITIDTDETVVPCADDNQSARIMGLTAGEHQATIVLLDASGASITTEASDKVVAAAVPADEPFTFMYDSFLSPIKETTVGDYLLQVFFEAAQLRCNETSPPAGIKAFLLKLDGTPVDAQVCYPGGSSCVSTLAGSDLGECLDTPQTIAGLPWGAYKLRIAARPAGSELTPCWMTDNGSDASGQIDILVGAGKVNPIVEHVLERSDSSRVCAPTPP